MRFLKVIGSTQACDAWILSFILPPSVQLVYALDTLKGNVLPLERAFFILSLESYRYENTLTYIEPGSVFLLWGSTKYQIWRHLSFLSLPVTQSFLIQENSSTRKALHCSICLINWTRAYDLNLANCMSHPKTLILEQMIWIRSDSVEFIYWNGRSSSLEDLEEGGSGRGRVSSGSGSDGARSDIQTRWFSRCDTVRGFFHFLWFLSVFWFFSRPSIDWFCKLPDMF